MTLVLTVASRDYVVQTADRLTTTDRSGVVLEHDTNANKVVVFTTKDAIATLGFSGVAYVGLTPTDEWLANILWDGKPAMRGPDGIRPAALTFGQRPRWVDLGSAIRAIVRSMDNLLGLNTVLLVSISGWQMDRHGTPRPFVAELKKLKGSSRVKTSRASRHWYEDRDWHRHAIGATVSKADWQEVLGSFSERLPTAEELESQLVNLTRQFHAKDSTVGPDIIGVVLPKPGLGTGKSRFHSQRRHLREQDPGDFVEVHMSPWVVDAGRLAPSLIVGDQNRLFDAYPFCVIGAPANNNVSFMCSSLKRRSSSV